MLNQRKAATRGGCVNHEPVANRRHRAEDVAAGGADDAHLRLCMTTQSSASLCLSHHVSSRMMFPMPICSSTSMPFQKLTPYAHDLNAAKRDPPAGRLDADELRLMCACRRPALRDFACRFINDEVINHGVPIWRTPVCLMTLARSQ